MTIKEYSKIYKKAKALIADVEANLYLIKKATVESHWTYVNEYAKKLAKATNELEKIKESMGLSDSDWDQQFLIHWLNSDEETFIRRMIINEEKEVTENE